jgi:hypothetical protein
MNRRHAGPGAEVRQEYFAYHQGFSLNRKSATASPGGIFLMKPGGKVVAVAAQMGELKGTAVHAWIFEKNGTQRPALDTPQVVELAAEAGQGEDTARKDLGFASAP